ncbi:MAG: hypothetical protein PWR17_1176 [Candidatus Methanomethylophilaceae archaeon]|nr:hypothetical protein [Candidatus Methanomethylophilaceae archaeon]
MKKNVGMMVIIAAVVMVVGIGEASIYFVNPYSYGSDFDIGISGAEYTLEASESIEYNVIAFDNHGVSPVTELIICLDDSNYYVSIEKELELRGFTDIIFADVAEVLGEMNGDATGRAILFPFGLFPEEIYDGDSTDPLFADWMDAGGSIYWFGCSEIPDDAYLLPFGLSTDSFNTSAGRETVGRSGDICDQLRLRTHNVYHGLRSDIGTPIAYTSESGYSSITAMKVSQGTMVYVGGDMDDDYSSDCAQIIASGITYATTVLGYREGVLNGSINGEIPYVASAEENVTVYVHMGGYYTVYGERFQSATV